MGSQYSRKIKLDKHSVRRPPTEWTDNLVKPNGSRWMQGDFTFVTIGWKNQPIVSSNGQVQDFRDVSQES